jgi:hypothetical protein
MISLSHNKLASLRTRDSNLSSFIEVNFRGENDKIVRARTDYGLTGLMKVIVALSCLNDTTLIKAGDFYTSRECNFNAKGMSLVGSIMVRSIHVLYRFSLIE